MDNHGFDMLLNKWKGSKDNIIQDIVLYPENTLFQRETYYTSSEKWWIMAALPSKLKATVFVIPV
ncbi:hypothetical protein QUF61_06375 [Candidatus Venteria ishoeyi]|uniref:hypothetical protein n=1 Tax=Candidatus Venteria ishoeyi TaxID=1899563 RepID=UPI0025A5B629|nr:hypothetical protein [Candidatus Venteria ishoeyi]MDM8546102.1 hypothetical protein [Candidatus Venteria ishoeyi]